MTTIPRTAAASPRNATATMRSMVLTAPRTAAVRDVPVPNPGPGQVRIRLEGCGVCGSNIPVWEGRPWFSYPPEPGKPGHEGWGVIDAVGENVRGLTPGDRVAALTYNAFAEHDIADAAAVVKLPPQLNGRPFPGEALGCAVNVFRRCNIQPGQTVAVVGVGFLGALIIQLAAGAGAHVIAASRRRTALDVARRMGAREIIPLEDHDAVLSRAKQLTGGRLCDVVIEAVGAQQPLDLAAELTRERGRLVIAGYHQDGPRQINMQLWNWRGLDVINAHERKAAVYADGVRRAVDLVVTGRLDPLPLYTHTYPLEQLADALHAASARPDGFMKALVLA